MGKCILKCMCACMCGHVCVITLDFFMLPYMETELRVVYYKLNI